MDHLKSEVAQRLTAEFGGKVIGFAVQKEALGTGDAAKRGVKELKGERGRVWIVPGDVPLIRPKRSRNFSALLNVQWSVY